MNYFDWFYVQYLLEAGADLTKPINRELKLLRPLQERDKFSPVKLEQFVAECESVLYTEVIMRVFFFVLVRFALPVFPHWKEFPSPNNNEGKFAGLNDSVWYFIGARLFPNVKGCGYPPMLNCSIFYRQYANVGQNFSCYYSKVDPGIVISDLDMWQVSGVIVHISHAWPPQLYLACLCIFNPESGMYKSPRNAMASVGLTWLYTSRIITRWPGYS